MKAVWVTAKDEAVCSICGKLDGKETVVGDEFNFNGRNLYAGQKETPPAHPRCRCVLTYEEILDANGKPIYENNGLGLSENNNSGIIKPITINDFKPIYEKGTISKDCVDEIYNALGNDRRYFNKVATVNIPKKANGTIDLLRTNVIQNGNWADVQLEINEAAFKGCSLDEINERILNSHNNGHCVMRNLKEAIWHEIGHAKIMYGATYARAEAITELLEDYHIDGISRTAYINGDECIAECYVLKCRGQEIPEEAEELFKRYIEEG